MRTWTKWLVPVLAIGLVGFAEAKKNKSDEAGGIKGKIVSVSAYAITIQEGRKSANGGVQQVTIHTGPSTSVEIDGVSGHRVTDLQAGEQVVIQGDPSSVATDIQAKSKKRGGGRRR